MVAGMKVQASNFRGTYLLRLLMLVSGTAPGWLLPPDKQGKTL